MVNAKGMYAKAIAAAVVAGMSAAIVALQNGHISMAEWATIASAVLIALGAVWAVPEFPVSIAKYAKAITSGLISALAAFTAVASSGRMPSQADWLTIAVAFVLGTGLVGVTNNSAVNQTMHAQVVAVQAPAVEQVGVAGAGNNEEVVDEDPALDAEPVEEDFTEK